MIKAVIFDLDNTLIDFMHMKNQAVDSAIMGMIEAGLNISYQDAKREIFKIYEEEGYEYQEVLNKFIVSVCNKVDYKLLAAGIVSYRKAKEKSLKTYSQADNTLIKLSKLGLKLGLITDAPIREAWTRLYTVNLHHIFDKVLTYDDTKAYKPSSVPFYTILDYFKIDPNEAIMVGDWPEKDICGAKNVGMQTAFAKYGNSNQSLDNLGADVVLNDISEILKYIESENKK
ncbi:MAG: hypothetical protein CMG00_05085 [Candidatus Marinimicrobia bacterium]|nr:hypothetical protein [Candidatus Neomarinimicrobiota bacterium]|tara:strand:- start:3815 stop:4501 length:687 start_codon:yes stop_codon:yes gene_type:complete